jgi:putative membrane protein
MTMPSEPAVPESSVAAQVALGAGRERRLHPFSWLFVLLASLREYALPLIALLFFGRGGGDSWEWFGLVGVGVLTLLAVVRYYTFRFRIEGGELVIRSGVLHRNVRNIPLARIQNVALKRNVLHRLFGVAEVKLESAVGGISAEAQMRVLSMRDAHALEVLVRSQGEAADGVDAEAEPDHGELLLSLPGIELLKLGLTSNRGLLIGAAGFGFLFQLDSAGWGWGRAIGASSRALFGAARDLHLGGVQWVLAALALAMLLIVVLRVVSILLVWTQYHGFRLSERDQRLSIESGLLTRTRSHAPLRKIQHWTLRDGIVHRWFGRRSLSVETAVMQVANEAHSLSDLVPIAAPERIDALLQRWLPWLRWGEVQWQPLHPLAWRRMLFFPLLFTALATALLCARYGFPGVLALASIPFWVMRAHRIAARSRWAVTDRVLARRSGWLERRVSFAEIEKLQGLQIVQSPFDRRHGMATLVADTAGASPLGHRLEIDFLPEAVARELHARLGAQISRSALRW